jgi:hypothetical protein
MFVEKPRNSATAVLPATGQTIKLASSECAAYFNQIWARHGKELAAGQLFHSNSSFITDSLGYQVSGREKKF